MSESTMKKKKKTRKPTDRRKKTRTMHRINANTSYRDEALARSDLVDFLTKLY